MLENMKRKSYPQQELAARFVEAMDEVELSQAEVARHCGVTPQAVHEWRETGRIGKQHLGLTVRHAFTVSEDFEPLLIAVYHGLSPNDDPPF